MTHRLPGIGPGGDFLYKDMSVSEPEPAIRAKDVHLSYGKLKVLRGVSFDLDAGEGVVLLGANGCGKSSLMRALNRLADIDSGSITVRGTDISTASGRALRSVRQEMGYVFQHFNLVPQLTAFQSVLLGMMGRRALGVLACLNMFASAQDRARAMACLERVGLADRALHRPSELSGGQQQRVAIARMLMQGPRIVIADEPIASLDPKAGREVLELLWQIVDEEGLGPVVHLAPARPGGGVRPTHSGDEGRHDRPRQQGQPGLARRSQRPLSWRCARGCHH